MGEWYQDLISHHDLPLTPAEKEGQETPQSQRPFLCHRNRGKVFHLDECKVASAQEIPFRKPLCFMSGNPVASKIGDMHLRIITSSILAMTK